MFLMHVGAAVLLAGGCLFWLSGAGYSCALAALLTVLILAEAGPLLAATTGQSLWLAVGVLAVAVSAEAFAKQVDVRRIILFGSALAAIQILDPLGGVVAAGLLPTTLVLGRQHGGARQTFGLYLLLMFVPLMMAVLLLYFVCVRHFDPTGFFAGSSRPDVLLASTVHAGLMWRLAPVAGFALIISPALLMPKHLHEGSRGMIALVAFGVAAAGAAGAILGVAREPIPLLAASVPIVIVALVQQPGLPHRNRDAFIVAILCMAFSWIAAFMLSPQVFTG